MEEQRDDAVLHEVERLDCTNRGVTAARPRDVPRRDEDGGAEQREAPAAACMLAQQACRVRTSHCQANDRVDDRREL